MPSPDIAEIRRTRKHREFDLERSTEGNRAELTDEVVAKIYAFPGRSRLPLYRYWHAGNDDVFLTWSWEEVAYGFGDWELTGVLGYVHRYPSPATQRLYRFFNEDQGRHAYSLVLDQYQAADGWTIESQQIHVPIGEVALPRLPDRPANATALERLVATGPSELILDGQDFDGVDLARLLGVFGDSGRPDVVRSVSLRGCVIDGPLALDLRNVRLDLSGADVSSNLRITVSEFADVMLSSAHVGGDLDIGAWQQPHARSRLIADSCVVDGHVSVHDVEAEIGVMRFDRARVGGIRVNGCSAQTISLASATSQAELYLDNVKANVVVATRAVSQDAFAVRSSRIVGHVALQSVRTEKHLHLAYNDLVCRLNLRGASGPTAIHLIESTFSDRVRLSYARFAWLDAHGCTFAGETDFDHLEIDDVLDFRASVFSRPVTLTSKAKMVLLGGARFEAESELVMQGALLFAGQCRFEQASRISSPRGGAVLDLNNTDVSKVTFTSCDLTMCSMSNISGLADARFGADCRLAESPRPGDLLAPTRFRATARPLVWDEILVAAATDDERWHVWALEHRHRVVASTSAVDSVWWARRVPALTTSVAATPDDLASVYGQVRRALEAQGDQRQANEMYYSEMTLRRRAASGWMRFALSVYGLLGGYGVRPSRPVAAFLVVVVATAINVVFGLSGTVVNGTVVPDSGIGPALGHVLRLATTLLGANLSVPIGFGGTVFDFAVKIGIAGLLALLIVGVRNVARRR